jgi:hypothetical protein
VLHLTEHAFVVELIDDGLAQVSAVRSQLDLLEARLLDADKQYRTKRKLRSRSVAQLRVLANPTG